MALSHLCRTPRPLIKCLVIPADIFQLVLPQKDISQMKDTYVFLQKAGPSCLQLLASKTDTEKGVYLGLILLKFTETKVNFSKNKRNAL